MRPKPFVLAGALGGSPADKTRKALIKAYLEPDSLSPRRLDDFAAVTRPRAKYMAGVRFGGAAESQQLVDAVLGVLERPLSVLQLRELLQRSATAAEAASGLEALFARPVQGRIRVPLFCGAHT